MSFFIYYVKLLAKEQQVASAASARGLKALQKPMTAKEKEEVRIEVEEQLKIQRALANAKRQGLNVPTVAGLNDSPPPSINTKTLQTRGGCMYIDGTIFLQPQTYVYYWGFGAVR